MWAWKTVAGASCSVASCYFWCISWPRRWVSASIWVAYCRFSILLSLRVHVIRDAFVALVCLFAWWKCGGWGRGWLILGYGNMWCVVCSVWRNGDFIVVLESDGKRFSPISSCTVCYSWFVGLVLPLCMTMMVTVCIIYFSEGLCYSRCIFLPFCATLRMWGLWSRLDDLRFWHCLVYGEVGILIWVWKMVPRDSSSVASCTSFRQLNSWLFYATVD